MMNYAFTQQMHGHKMHRNAGVHRPTEVHRPFRNFTLLGDTGYERYPAVKALKGYGNYKSRHYRPLSRILTNAGIHSSAEVSRSFQNYSVLAEKGHGNHPRAKELRMKLRSAKHEFHRTLDSVPHEQKRKALELAKEKAPQMERAAWGNTIGMALLAMTSAYGLLEGTLAKPVQAILKAVGVRADISEVIVGGICLLGAAFIAYARTSFKGHQNVQRFISALETPNPMKNEVAPKGSHAVRAP